jgi:hypothetical protein
MMSATFKPRIMIQLVVSNRADDTVEVAVGKHSPQVLVVGSESSEPVVVDSVVVDSVVGYPVLKEDEVPLVEVLLVDVELELEVLLAVVELVLLVEVLCEVVLIPIVEKLLVVEAVLVGTKHLISLRLKLRSAGVGAFRFTM